MLTRAYTPSGCTIAVANCERSALRSSASVPALATNVCTLVHGVRDLLDFLHVRVHRYGLIKVYMNE